MKIECGGLLFTSDFDSGNLDKVEFVENSEINKSKTCESCSDTNLPPVSNFRFVRRPKNRPETPVSSPVHSKKYQLKKRSLHSKIKSNTSKKSFSELSTSIREFKVWTKPDCSGTPYQTTFRTWFYFGIAGGPPGIVVKINVMNLNRQGKLYFHGMKPVFKVVPSTDGWKRIPGKVDFKCASDGNFTISFCHTLSNENESMTYFAFTYPFSYSECQNMLDAIDEKLGTSLYISKPNRPPDSTIYYSRELLCYTAEGNKVELLTVTSCKGLTMEREKNLPDLFPDNSKPRCHVFQNKKVVFISSRVHPGETPSSFVLNGMLHYLTSSKDGIANRLRNLFVFKIIPMLNPDGVLKGHYRADLQGLNLNRIYMVANFQEHPSIYAARTALLHYHASYSSSVEAMGSSKSTLRKPQNHQININTRFNQKSKNVPKNFSKDIINQIHQTKALGPKHSLHTCDTISKNLNFLQSVPVILPISNKVCDSIFSNQDSKNSSDKMRRVSPVSVVNEDSLDLTIEDMKRIGRSSEGCSECKLSDYPSKKVQF